MELCININVRTGFQFNYDVVIANADLFAAESTVVCWQSS